jgi:hypothetical protein
VHVRLDADDEAPRNVGSGKGGCGWFNFCCR